MPINCTAQMTLGTLCVSVEAQKTTTFRILEQQYGDGYVARRQDGVNPVSERWRVQTPTMAWDQCQTLEDELIALGAGNFEWMPPNETVNKRWVLDPPEWEWSFATESQASLSFTLRRWYR